MKEERYKIESAPLGSWTKERPKALRDAKKWEFVRNEQKQIITFSEEEAESTLHLVEAYGIDTFKVIAKIHKALREPKIGFK